MVTNPRTVLSFFVVELEVCCSEGGCDLKDLISRHGRSARRRPKLSDCLFSEKLDELAELRNVKVRGGAEIHIIAPPKDQVVALDRLNCGQLRGSGFDRPDEHVDEMLLPLIDKRSYVTIIEIIQATPNERESLTGKVSDRRRKIQFSVEPGFHGVLVGGLHVEQVTWLQRAYMARDNFLGEQNCLPLTTDIRNHSCSQNKRDDDGSGNREPLEDGAAAHRNQFALAPITG